MHLSVRDTARVRLFLHCSYLLSRQNQRKANGCEKASEKSDLKGGRLHDRLMGKMYTFRAWDGASRRPSSRNTLNAALGHNQKNNTLTIYTTLL